MLWQVLRLNREPDLDKSLRRRHGFPFKGDKPDEGAKQPV